MVRVRLKGSPQTQWNIDGHYFPGRDPVDLSPAQVRKNKLFLEEVLDKDFLMDDAVLDNSSEQVFTEEELFKLSRAEQIEMLKKKGITKVPSTEKERVKLLLGVKR